MPDRTWALIAAIRHGVSGWQLRGFAPEDRTTAHDRWPNERSTLWFPVYADALAMQGYLRAGLTIDEAYTKHRDTTR